MSGPPQTRLREDDLRWDHYNHSGGVGSIALTHLPAGIVVNRDCGDTPITQIHRELRSELELKVAVNSLGRAADETPESN